MNQLQTYSEPERYTRSTDAQLKDVFAVIWRRIIWIAIIFVLCMGGVFAYIRHAHKKWTATAQLILVQRPIQALTGPQDYQSPELDSIDTQVGMMQSSAMIDRAVEWMRNNAVQNGQMSDSVQDVYSDLGSINISTPPDTSLLNISVDGRSPEDASLYANAVCQAFVQWKQELARQDLKNAEQSLTIREQKARTDLKSAEQAELAYQNKYEIVNLSAAQSQVLGEVQASQSAIDGLQQELQSQTARVATLKSQLDTANAEIKSGSGVRDDTLVLDLQQQLTTAEAARADDAEKYTSHYPGVLNQDDARIADLKARIAAAIKGTVNNSMPSLEDQGTTNTNYQNALVDLRYDTAKLAAAQAQHQSAETQLDAMPNVGLAYTDLQNRVDVAGQLYSSLESALNSANLDEDKTSSNVQVTQEAYVSPNPTSPNVPRVVIIGLLVAGVISFLVVMVIEQFDRRIRTVSDVHKWGPMPVIGTMPNIGRLDIPNLNRAVLPVSVAEACSLTRASLTQYFKSSNASQMSRCIMVTSAAEGEGKSIVATQLALSLARAGKSVMLIDANLREPVVHKMLDVPVAPGLSNMLLKGATFQDTLVLSEDLPTLSVLTAGDIPDCASDVLSSDRLPEILRIARFEADIVIVDAPSCSVSDPLLIAPHVDYSIQVVALGLTQEDSVGATHTALLKAGSPSVGVLINRTGKKDRQAYRIYGVQEAAPRKLPELAMTSDETAERSSKAFAFVLPEGHFTDSDRKKQD
jgi:polysaccharide biosynthesis transport protein